MTVKTRNWVRLKKGPFDYDVKDFPAEISAPTVCPACGQEGIGALGGPTAIIFESPDLPCKYVQIVGWFCDGAFPSDPKCIYGTVVRRGLLETESDGEENDVRYKLENGQKVFGVDIVSHEHVYVVGEKDTYHFV